MEKNWHLAFGLAFFLAVTIAFAVGLQYKFDEPTTVATSEKTQKEDGPLEYNPPSMDNVPEGKLGESIKYGHKIMMETNTVLDGYVGNQLSCASCHGNAGLDRTSSFVGVTTQFPEYNPRAGEMFTIEDRINGCMVRSMNGEEIPYDSDEMRAMVAYLTYISKDIPSGTDKITWRKQNTMKNPPTPNIDNGEKLYKQSCLSCHGANGEGTGPNTGPALWGDNSYNTGAGMARLSKAAGYIQRNMPLVEMGGIGQGELTDQQAADLAAYINSQERPVYEGRAKDWPNGDAPADVPYRDELESLKNN